VHISPRLNLLGVTIKNPFFLEGDTSRLRSIALQRLGEVEKRIVIAPYKVELTDIPLNVLLTSLGDIIANLDKKEIYFVDFDITQDLAGTFDMKKSCVDIYVPNTILRARNGNAIGLLLHH